MIECDPLWFAFWKMMGGAVCWHVTPDGSPSTHNLNNGSWRQQNNKGSKEMHSPSNISLITSDKDVSILSDNRVYMINIPKRTLFLCNHRSAC